VYRGIDDSGLPERWENGILQRLSVHSNRDAGVTDADQMSLLSSDDENGFFDAAVTVA